MSAETGLKVVFICAVLLIATFVTGMFAGHGIGYQSGQIDAIEGRIKYEKFTADHWREVEK